MTPFSRFFRSGTRDATATFGSYLRGLFLSERATLLRMSEVNAVDHQAMTHLLTAGAVDWDGCGDQLAQEANVLLGSPQSVLLIDESAFAKKGERSAGVARQWHGRLGKVDNCQVGVFAALCRGEMASMVDARDYRSKTSLALEMVATAQRRGLRFGYVGVDGGYGKEPAFLYGFDALGCRFVADVHCHQWVYLQDPAPQVPGEPAQHAAAHLLFDHDNHFHRQCRALSELDPTGLQRLENPVENAAVVVEVAIERSSEAMDQGLLHCPNSWVHYVDQRRIKRFPLPIQLSAPCPSGYAGQGFKQPGARCRYRHSGVTGENLLCAGQCRRVEGRRLVEAICRPQTRVDGSRFV